MVMDRKTTVNTIIYAGWDRLECESYRVFLQSLYNTARKPENIVVYPLIQPVLRNVGLYTRPADEQAATDFSLTRFLVPHLNGYKGHALFIDGADMIFTRPIEEILAYADSKYAVQVVKHPEYVPRIAKKMDNAPQTTYPRKNWSSVILFNCEHFRHKMLKDYLNGWTQPSTCKDVWCGYDTYSPKPPKFFHRFEWLLDEEIGELPLDFNFLVGEYMGKKEWEDTHDGHPPLNVHHTSGCPMYPERAHDEYGELFFEHWLNMTGERHPNDPILTDQLVTKSTKLRDQYSQMVKELDGKQVVTKRECRNWE